MHRKQGKFFEVRVHFWMFLRLTRRIPGRASQNVELHRKHPGAVLVHPHVTGVRWLLLAQTFPVDTNRDGLTDRLEVNARLPLGEGEEVHSVKMLAFFLTRLRVRSTDSALPVDGVFS